METHTLQNVSNVKQMLSQCYTLIVNKNDLIKLITIMSCRRRKRKKNRIEKKKKKKAFIKFHFILSDKSFDKIEFCYLQEKRFLQTNRFPIDNITLDRQLTQLKNYKT
ncbi:hypothetical protein CHUAL_001685 [Chamberlinius hualienensis]